METNLRQANAKVNVEGIVSEKKLDVVTENGVKRIEGYITVKTDETNFVRFNVRVNEKTKAGTANKTYAGIETVMDTYKSIASEGEDEADRIRVTGDINLYRSRNTGQEIVGYKSNFFTRVRDNYSPHAEFSVEVFIEKFIPEIDSEGMETGRVKIGGWVPTYNGIEPIELIVGEDLADDLSTVYEVGQTAEFYGEVINSRVETVTERKAAFGKARTQKNVSYKNELLVTGGTAPYEEGISAEMPYNPEVIKMAIAERNNRIEEEKSNRATNNNPSAAGTGRVLNMNW